MVLQLHLVSGLTMPVENPFVSHLSPEDQAIHDAIWQRKLDFFKPPHQEWMGVAVADLTRDVVLEKGVLKKGSTVLIWMISRFMDVGIAKDLSAQYYDARVEVDALVNWRFRNMPKPPKPKEETPREPIFHIIELPDDEDAGKPKPNAKKKKPKKKGKTK